MIPKSAPWLVLALGLSCSSCSFFQSAKPAIKTANELAQMVCAAHEAQKRGITADEALNTVCQDLKVLQPYLDLILSTEKSGVPRQKEGCEK